MISVYVETGKLPASFHIRSDSGEFLFENLRKSLHKNFDLVRSYARFDFLKVRPHVVDARTEWMNVKKRRDETCEKRVVYNCLLW